jgi:hypothetical protein
MKKHGKKYNKAAALIEAGKRYSPADACALVKKTASAKYDETVEVAVKLGVDPRHADQMIRGAVVLPAGTGATSSRRPVTRAPTSWAPRTSWRRSTAASSTSTSSSPRRT